jgi:predicted RNA binding protein YcfA (HicA-like mRNA interferase family)
MGAGFYPQLRALLLQHGCRLVRQGKGSHEFWESPISGARFPVAVTVNTRHTANAVLKEAGITQKL